jgi:hypothetical protein
VKGTVVFGVVPLQGVPSLLTVSSSDDSELMISYGPQTLTF